MHKGSFLFPSQINKQLHFVPLRKTKLDYFSQTVRADALPVASLLQSEAPQKRKKKKERKTERARLPTYRNAYRQSSDTKASSACVYRAAAATLDPESQWAHRASDAHLFQSSQRTTKQQTLIPM